MTSLRLYQLFMNLFPSQRQLTHVPGTFIIKLMEKSFKFQFEEFLACDRWLNNNSLVFFFFFVLHFVNLAVVLYSSNGLTKVLKRNLACLACTLIY